MEVGDAAISAGLLRDKIPAQPVLRMVSARASILSEAASYSASSKSAVSRSDILPKLFYKLALKDMIQLDNRPSAA